MISTYAELKASIADWLVRDDLVNQVEDFIQLAEDEIIDILLQSMPNDFESSVDLSVVDGIVTLPTDYIGFRRVYVDQNTPCELTYKAPHDFHTLNYPESDRPSYFTIEGNQLLIAPGSTQTLKMLYYKFDRLSNSNTSNALLSKRASIYLYCALAQAEPFLQNDERVNFWVSKYQNALDLYMTANQSTRYGGAPLIP